MIYGASILLILRIDSRNTFQKLLPSSRRHVVLSRRCISKITNCYVRFFGRLITYNTRAKLMESILKVGGVSRTKQLVAQRSRMMAIVMTVLMISVVTGIGQNFME